MGLASSILVNWERASTSGHLNRKNLDNNRVILECHNHNRVTAVAFLPCIPSLPILEHCSWSCSSTYKMCNCAFSFLDLGCHLVCIGQFYVEASSMMGLPWQLLIDINSLYSPLTSERRINLLQDVSSINLINLVVYLSLCVHFVLFNCIPCTR